MPEGDQEVRQEIDVKTAVVIAMDYFAELFGGPYADLSLEEVERKGDSWYLTLGYTPGRKVGDNVVIPANATRQYKQIIVNVSSGEVESMKVKRM
jgi:hypothetical protein